LPPVSTTQGELVAKFAAGVVDTGGQLPELCLEDQDILNKSVFKESFQTPCMESKDTLGLVSQLSRRASRNSVWRIMTFLVSQPSRELP